MKKLTLIVTALAVLSLASCKKAYDCTCETTTDDASYSATAIMTQYEDLVDDINDGADDESPLSSTYKTVTSMDKTSKAAANVECGTTITSTNYEEYADAADEDDDNNEEEPAYSISYVSTTTCSLAKK